MKFEESWTLGMKSHRLTLRCHVVIVVVVVVDGDILCSSNCCCSDDRCDVGLLASNCRFELFPCKL